MDRLGLADRKIPAVAMVSIVEHPIGIDDSVDFVVVVWPLQCDRSVIADVVIVAAERTIVANSTLEGFHGLCDIPVWCQSKLEEKCCIDYR